MYTIGVHVYLILDGMLSPFDHQGMVDGQHPFKALQRLIEDDSEGSERSEGPPPPPPAAAAAADLTSQLKELAELKAAGMLDEDEFKAAKSKLLGT